jgi:hypothetical protein
MFSLKTDAIGVAEATQNKIKRVPQFWALILIHFVKLIFLKQLNLLQKLSEKQKNKIKAR